MAALGVVVSLCILLTMCQSNVEVMESLSPDGALKARVFETNGGATTDFGYTVSLDRASFPHWDRSVAGFDGAQRSNCAYGVNIKWLDNDTLVISYLDARAVDVDSSARLFGRTVRILSKAGINDPKALCGGMEYAQNGDVIVVR
jgi:hypothetical protein